MSEKPTPVMPAQILPRQLGRFNVRGAWTLVLREGWRFLEPYPQTIIAPVITTVLFYAIFVLALGGSDRLLNNGLPYVTFLLPGLVMMAVAQNAFAQSAVSILLSKIQGNLVDVLMAPISPLELTIGYVSGGVMRGLAVGITSVAALWMFAPITIAYPMYVVGYAVLGSALLSLLGVLTGIWAEKFDHMATVQNFVIMPATFLSGTFYTLDQLPEKWQSVCLLNPFFYMIDGFRYGFTGQAEGSILVGLLLMAVCNAALFAVAWYMFRIGYRLKAG